MKEDFVPYELAVKLKEKGFKMPCIAHYCCLDGNVLKFNITADCIRGSNFKVLNEKYNIYIDAPTISQVLKWLREKKKIHLIVEISDSGWYYTLYPNIRWENGKLKSDKYFMSFKHNPSYELAALAGIEYVIDNLI